MKGLRAIVLGLALAALLPLKANEPIVFDDPAQEQRFRDLTSELRCLVCQNQSLADSDAFLADDLRHEIHDMMVAGQTDAQIKEFLVARYGDFVLYRPPVQSNTVLLWAAPLLLLIIGGGVIMIAVRKRAALLESETGEQAEPGQNPQGNEP